MAFWSGEKLKERLYETDVGNKSFIEPFYENCIDCAAYTLSLGGEVFITEGIGQSDIVRPTTKTLTDKEHIIIPQGQFAFLMTDETVKVPHDAIAFISMKARQKFKGLINVSGFHVDPGWNGKLIFSVYNAGPMPVNLKQGDQLFLIWYSDLDRTSEKVKKSDQMQTHIDSKLLDGMNGQVFSPMSLNKKIERLENKVSSILSGFLVLGAAVGIIILMNTFMSKPNGSNGQSLEINSHSGQQQIQNGKDKTR
ncbi:MAG: hypothetical protein JKY87_00845 [Mariprofundus sp.]|nr:hypothetical protein [Mariprofundus sp.]